MAELGQFGDVFGNVAGNILNITVLAVLGLLAAGVVGYAIYYFFFYRKKFNIDVKITSLRSKDPFIILDKAALLYDKKNKTDYMKLWSTKKEFNMPPFNIIQQTSKGDYLELYRKSEDEFAFLTKPKIDKEWIIRADGKKWPLARMQQRQIEADYYWLLKRRTEDKSWINPESAFTKILQMLPILIPGALMIVVFLFFLNSLPEVLGKLVEVIDKLGTLEGVASKG